MKYIFLTVVLVAVSLYTGITEGDILLGIKAAAVSVVLVQLLRLWMNFWAKHPKLAKAGKTLLWILGIILVVILSMMGLPLIPLAVGAVLLVAMIQSIPGMRRKQKQETEEYLNNYRRALDQDMDNWKRKKALDEEKRKAARAEAEHLEDLARLWERNAQKYGTAADIRKARDFREQANAAWRRIR